MAKKVSVIIPAYNESAWIEKSIKSFKAQNYHSLEVIVVDNSADNGATRQVAEKFADKVIVFNGPIGACKARNEGAKIAAGEVLIFSDADTFLEEICIRKMADIVGENTIGTVLGEDIEGSFQGKIFFAFKNLIHRLRIYDGVAAGTFFCHKNIFEKAGGFNEGLKIAEFADFIKRAKKAGAEYKLLANCCAATSMRRYEKKGYIKTIIFWIKWRIASLFGKGKNLTDDYFNISNK